MARRGGVEGCLKLFDSTQELREPSFELSRLGNVVPELAVDITDTLSASYQRSVKGVHSETGCFCFSLGLERVLEGVHFLPRDSELLYETIRVRTTVAIYREEGEISKNSAEGASGSILEGLTYMSQIKRCDEPESRYPE